MTHEVRCMKLKKDDFYHFIKLTSIIYFKNVAFYFCFQSI